MSRGFLQDLLRLPQTVFSIKQLALLWRNSDRKTIKARLNYYVKEGSIYPIRRGLYGKDKKYDRLEVAVKIYTPAYISFETVLVQAGIIFQHYSQIFVATYKSKTLICDEQMYVFRKIKASILVQELGIEEKENYKIASPERAYLDILYLHKDYYFDNLSSLDWNKVQEILPIYQDNKRMARIVKKHYRLVQNNLGEK